MVLHRVQKLGGVPPSFFVDRAVVVAATLALAALLVIPAIPPGGGAAGQTPSPTPIVAPADPRTEPEPPSETGAPLLAALAVLLLGGSAALMAFVYVRLAARR